jgi:hypothetical protein
MPSLNRALGMYLQLARAAGLRGQGGIRDKLLVLAGVTAVEIDQPDVAAECRLRIVDHNPQHLVRRWSTFAEALDDEEFLAYLKQQIRRYSAERVEHLLEQLGIDPFTPGEFAVGDEGFAQLMQELDEAQPGDDDVEILSGQHLLGSSGGALWSDRRPYLPPRRYNRLQPNSTVWLVVLLGIIACAIYIALALSG